MIHFLIYPRRQLQAHVRRRLLTEGHLYGLIEGGKGWRRKRVAKNCCTKALCDVRTTIDVKVLRLPPGIKHNYEGKRCRIRVRNAREAGLKRFRVVLLVIRCELCHLVLMA